MTTQIAPRRYLLRPTAEARAASGAVASAHDTPRALRAAGLALAVAATALCLMGGASRAEDMGQMDHASHGAAPKAEDTASEAFAAINHRMHKNMAVEFTGDADQDFIRGMIPHHQGAVEMAEVVLKHGHDPEVRKLAEEIIAAQMTEIAWMEQWLKDHPTE